LSGTRYESLLARGFRRSGRFVYRPYCGLCQSCVPVRLAVERFAPNRSQRRNLVRNRDLVLMDRPAVFDPEHFALYAAYLRHRHPDGGMADQLSPESYHDFLIQPWGGETRLLELRLEGRLVALAVTDRLPGALSAVYTCFEPALSSRALGACALLNQIALARRLGLGSLYLGYWIQDCRKMAYKDDYRPIQALIGTQWREFRRGEPIA
jgi:arginine-tRNA-protein transferase